MINFGSFLLERRRMRFTFFAVGVSVYQFGNFGTAAKLLLSFRLTTVSSNDSYRAHRSSARRSESGRNRWQQLSKRGHSIAQLLDNAGPFEHRLIQIIHPSKDDLCLEPCNSPLVVHRRPPQSAKSLRGSSPETLPNKSRRLAAMGIGSPRILHRV